MVRRVTLLVFVALAALLAGCSQGASNADTITPVFAFSEAVVGPNRLALGIVRNNTPINEPDAQVHLRFFYLDDTTPEPLFEADATYYGAGLPAAVYVAYVTFDRPGNWGIEVQTQLPDRDEPDVQRLRLEVREQSAAPNVGEQAISVPTLTVDDVPDLAQLSSGSEPDPALYQISLDEALRSGRPTALLFATPAYCRTAVCGPSLEVLEDLQKTYGDRINFIHVEVYKYPFDESFNAQNQVIQQAYSENRPLTPEEQITGLSDATAAWGLPSEPWLFLIDAEGTIVARYEGGITVEEISPALDQLAAGEPVLPLADV